MPVFQRGRSGDDFKRRGGRINALDGQVVFVDFFGLFGVFFVAVRHKDVGVVRGRTGHGQYRAGARVQRHGGAAAGFGIFKAFFGRALEFEIQRQIHVTPGGPFFILDDTFDTAAVVHFQIHAAVGAF